MDEHKFNFREWMISEETKEERAAREDMATGRRIAWEKYLDLHNQHKQTRPDTPFSMRDPAWVNHAKSGPKSPLNDFRDEVDEEIRRITGVWPHEIIPDATEDEKQAADSYRIASMVEDSYDDGTSAEEAARMAVEVLKSMGYLK